MLDTNDRRPKLNEQMTLYDYNLEDFILVYCVH